MCERLKKARSVDREVKEILIQHGVPNRCIWKFHTVKRPMVRTVIKKAKVRKMQSAFLMAWGDACVSGSESALKEFWRRCDQDHKVRTPYIPLRLPPVGEIQLVD